MCFLPSYGKDKQMTQSQEEELANKIGQICSEALKVILEEKNRHEIDKVLGTELCCCGKCTTCQWRYR